MVLSRQQANLCSPSLTNRIDRPSVSSFVHPALVGHDFNFPALKSCPWCGKVGYLELKSEAAMRLRVLCLIAFSPFVSAELYKCSDASGAVTYQATPCVAMSEEILKVQRVPQRQPDENSLPGVPETDEIIGNRSSANSPLAKAYKKFVRSLGACQRDQVLKVVSQASGREMMAISLKDFKAQCRIMKSLARTDFQNAFEQIETRTAKLVWQEKEQRRDGAETMRSSMKTTANFVKENGSWVFGK
jgi:hypothetical protein